MSDISDIETLAVEQERATNLGVVIKSISYRAPATSKTAIVFYLAKEISTNSAHDDDNEIRRIDFVT